jgi:retron-type reverse transcriptase
MPIIQKRYLTSHKLSDIQVFKNAYYKTKSEPGNMTKGTDGETIDGTSLRTLAKLQKDVLDWSYKCNPSRRIYIPKSNGNLRPIGIPCYRDKLLQRILLDIMTPICEKVFHNRSFAFRPGRSVHHALIKVGEMIGIT